MKKSLVLFSLLAASLSGLAHADDAAIKQSLAKLGVTGSDIQPAPIAGMKTVMTSGGVLYVTEDGKHFLQGPLYDVSGRLTTCCQKVPPNTAVCPDVQQCGDCTLK